MRICFFGDSDSIHVQRWCKHFAGKGHEVHLISFKKYKSIEFATHFLDAGTIDVAGGNWRTLLTFYKLRKLLHTIRPSVLHAMYASSYGITGALSGFHPYVITAFGSDVLVSPKSSAVLRWLLRWAFGKADALTAMSDDMRKCMIELGAAPEKTDTVIFGIDPKIFNHTHRTLQADKFVVVSTRNFEPVYNHEQIVDALALAKEKIPALEIHFTGDGTLRPKIQQRLHAAGLGECTTFHGRVTQHTIATLLNKANLFLTMSYSDGNNISLNEAMACGAVSVASDIPANRQWIAEGVNGYLVPVDDVPSLADAILKVFHSFEVMQSKAMQYNDQIIKEKALWEVNMDKVEKMYHALTSPQ